MGTAAELAALLELLAGGLRPVVDEVFPFAAARLAFEKLWRGDVFGKVVLDHTS
jgi:NADPH:quinone reductase-like Zn-dependent oxidoreductase